MKFELLKSKQTRIPEIKEYFLVNSKTHLFLRITDCQGKRAMDHIEDEDRYFYAINLEVGQIVFFSKNIQDITILKQVNAATFEQVTG